MTTFVLEELSGADLRHLAYLRDTEIEREIAREDERDRGYLERLLPRMDEVKADQIREALDEMAIGVVVTLFWPAIAPLVGAAG